MESPDRFARDLITQLTGHDFLKREGFTLIPTTAPDFFVEDTPTRARDTRRDIRVRQGEHSRQAQGRSRATAGVRVQVRRAHVAKRPEVVALAKQLRRKRRKGRRLSLREISAELAAAGHVNDGGQPYAATSVKNMLAMRVQEARA
jgi:hypothetical protein